MHPETRASRGEHPIPCGGAVCGIPGAGCSTAREIARRRGEAGSTEPRSLPGWSCRTAAAFLLFAAWKKPPGRPSLDGGPGPSAQVVVRLPGVLRTRAVRAAAVHGTSLSALVRAALERYLDVLESEPPPVPVEPPPAAAVLLIAERSRARAPVEEPFDAAHAYAEADAADAAARASRGGAAPGPIP